MKDKRSRKTYIKMRRERNKQKAKKKIQTQEITKEDIYSKGTAKEMRFVQHRNRIARNMNKQAQEDGGQ